MPIFSIDGREIVPDDKPKATNTLPPAGTDIFMEVASEMEGQERDRWPLRDGLIMAVAAILRFVVAIDQNVARKDRK